MLWNTITVVIKALNCLKISLYNLPFVLHAKSRNYMYPRLVLGENPIGGNFWTRTPTVSGPRCTGFFRTWLACLKMSSTTAEVSKLSLMFRMPLRIRLPRIGSHMSTHIKESMNFSRCTSLTVRISSTTSRQEAVK